VPRNLVFAIADFSLRSKWQWRDCEEGFEMMLLKSWSGRHPRLAAWFALAVGMVIILLWSAKDVALLPTQLAALVIATIILAGLCVWIIGWEDHDEPPPES